MWFLIKVTEVSSIELPGFPPHLHPPKDISGKLNIILRFNEANMILGIFNVTENLRLFRNLHYICLKIQFNKLKITLCLLINAQFIKFKLVAWSRIIGLEELPELITRVLEKNSEGKDAEAKEKLLMIEEMETERPCLRWLVEISGRSKQPKRLCSNFFNHSKKKCQGTHK